MLSNAQPKPKPGPSYAKAKRARLSLDRSENEKVHARSGGRCELLETYQDSIVPYRCTRRAVHVHHLIGGWRIRGANESGKAERKLDLCLKCHSDIHGKKLVRVQGGTPHCSHTYRRSK